MPVARQIVLQVARGDIGQLTYIAQHLGTSATQPPDRQGTRANAPATYVTGAWSCCRRLGEADVEDEVTEVQVE